MPDIAPEAARSYAFCYLGALRCAKRLESILLVLPEEKRENYRLILQRADRLTPEEIANRVLVLREKVNSHTHLPLALQRLLSACKQDRDGRQDH